ncbi:O-antigen ligase family protein [Candidatus Entotheonella palauensis]|uniref:O-antigen ligase-related domain-containing protein n=1 Tax=Candidatus Entotheonella gemina TaxID=1429439 RepID=W4MGE0_9BACT|nr:O-antigen ligase family protein [Candidatus Entotheonella palauensis]ETX08747.1 MAG: hypothetical protein ETSY2_03540 [Candidatus Entotheonella gemina]
MIARRFSGSRHVDLWGTLGAILGSVLLLAVLSRDGLELKWIAFVFAGLLWGVITLLSGSVKKPLFVLFVLGLQMYIALYLGDGESYAKRWAGLSGPSGFVIAFVSIPAFCLLGLHALERVVQTGLRPFQWGADIGYPALLLMFTTAMTIAYTPERWRVTFYLFELIQFYIIFLVVVNIVVSRQDIDRTINLLMAVLCMQCLVYFVQTALGVTFTLTGEVIHVDGGFGRHGGTVSTRPAPFASFMMPLLFIAISRFLVIRNSRTRFYMGLLAAMGGLALLLTFTRAAWTGFALGLVWLIGLGAKRRLIRPLRLWFILGALGLVVLIMLPHVMARLTSDHSSDYEERLRLIRMAWNVIQAHPILGVGAGAYSFVFRQYQPHQLLDQEVWVYIVHNVYLLRWAESGIIGLLSLLWLFFAGFRKSLTCSRLYDENQAALALGCSAGIVALLWEMMWDLSLGFSANAMIWFLFGLLMAVHRVGFDTLHEVWPGQRG